MSLNPKGKITMKNRLFCLLFVTLIFMSGCVAGPNPATNTANDVGNIAGFLQGLWQGMTSLATFIISLFYDNITFYEVHNNGHWYNFGFILGISGVLGGVSVGACSRK